MIFETPHFNLDSYTTMAIIGQKGAGKTIGLQIIVEELMEKGRKVYVLDTMGVMEIDKSIEVKILPNTPPETIIEFMQADKNMKAIVFNLSALDLPELVAFADIVFPLIPNNVAILVDEIADYCPQKPSKPYSAQIARRWRVGRNQGQRPIILATQRPQMCDKNLLALSDVFCFLRVFHSRDLERVKELFNMTTQDFRPFGTKLKAFKTRECFLFGFDLPILETKFVKRNG